MKKQGFEFSFTWLFVLIVGATILILAIFMASRLITREGQTYNTEVAADLGASLIPIETTIESGKYYPLAFPAETRITNECIPDGTFGMQEISTSVRSGIGEEWPEEGIPYRTSNAFIFSSPEFQSEKAHVIAAPIMMPYKIGNALALYHEPYCFVDAPEEFEDSIVSLGAEGMSVVDQRSGCLAESITVCFGGSGCDIHVQVTRGTEGTIRKNSQTLAFIDGLFYAALVSDKTLYDCQLTRIRKRASELARIYAEKGVYLDARGCSNSLTGPLSLYQARLLTNAPLDSIMNDAEALQYANERLACRVF